MTRLKVTLSLLVVAAVVARGGATPYTNPEPSSTILTSSAVASVRYHGGSVVGSEDVLVVVGTTQGAGGVGGAEASDALPTDMLVAVYNVSLDAAGPGGAPTELVNMTLRSSLDDGSTQSYDPQGIYSILGQESGPDIYVLGRAVGEGDVAYPRLSKLELRTAPGGVVELRRRWTVRVDETRGGNSSPKGMTTDWARHGSVFVLGEMDEGGATKVYVAVVSVQTGAVGATMRYPSYTANSKDVGAAVIPEMIDGRLFIAGSSDGAMVSSAAVPPSNLALFVIAASMESLDRSAGMAVQIPIAGLDSYLSAFALRRPFLYAVQRTVVFGTGAARVSKLLYGENSIEVQDGFTAANVGSAPTLTITQAYVDAYNIYLAGHTTANLHAGHTLMGKRDSTLMMFNSNMGTSKPYRRAEIGEAKGSYQVSGLVCVTRACFLIGEATSPTRGHGSGFLTRVPLCHTGARIDTSVFNRPFEECVSCPSGTAQAVSNAHECPQCALGQFSPAPRTASCSACPAGTIAPTNGSISCSDCPPGSSAGAPGSSECAPCAAGSYADSTASKTCTLCSPGSASSAVGATSAATCQSCSAGTYASGSGNAACSDCPGGQYQPSSASVDCLRCPLGTASNSTKAVSAATCTLCPPGSYAETTGRAVCTKCFPGTVSTVAGATNRTACVDCPPGTSAEAGTAVCVDCPPGTYAPKLGTVQCFPCPKGSHNNLPRQLVCKGCLENHYSDVEGQLECTKCPFNTVSPPQAAHKKLCLCPSRTYGSAQLDMPCRPCPQGAQCSPQKPFPETELGKWFSSSVPDQLMSCAPKDACPPGYPETRDAAATAWVGRGHLAPMSAGLPARGDGEGIWGAGAPGLRAGFALQPSSTSVSESACRTGHTGEACHSCVEGYYRSSGGLCEACPSAEVSSSVVTSLLVVGCVVGWLAVCMLPCLVGSCRAGALYTRLAKGGAVSTLRAIRARNDDSMPADSRYPTSLNLDDEISSAKAKRDAELAFPPPGAMPAASRDFLSALHKGPSVSKATAVRMPTKPSHSRSDTKLSDVSSEPQRPQLSGFSYASAGLKTRTNTTGTVASDVSYEVETRRIPSPPLHMQRIASASTDEDEKNPLSAMRLKSASAGMIGMIRMARLRQEEQMRDMAEGMDDPAGDDDEDRNSSGATDEAMDEVSTNACCGDGRSPASLVLTMLSYVIKFCQLAFVVFNAEARWPAAITALQSAVAVVYLSPEDYYSSSCTTSSSSSEELYRQRYMLRVMAPIVSMATLAVICAMCYTLRVCIGSAVAFSGDAAVALSMRIGNTSRVAIPATKNGTALVTRSLDIFLQTAMRVALHVALISYISVHAQVVELMTCYERSSGQFYLRAEPTVQCFVLGGTWSYLLPFCVLGVLASSLLVPTAVSLCIFVLHRHRHHPRIQWTFGMLWSSYHTSAYWWGAVDIWFKAVITFFSLLSSSSAGDQLLFMMVLLVAMIAVQMVCHPYRHGLDATMDNAVTVTVLCMVVTGMMFEANNDEISTVGGEILVACVILCYTMLTGVAVAYVICACSRACDQARSVCRRLIPARGAFKKRGVSGDQAVMPDDGSLTE